MKDKKTAGDDDVPGDVLTLLGEYGLKLTTRLINNNVKQVSGPRILLK
jgi:hypothetical protein